MAMARNRKDETKRENKTKYCRCVVTVLQVVAFCQNVSNIAAQDYLNTNGHDSNGALFARQTQKIDAQNLPFGDINVLSLLDRIRFDPPFLDFGSQPVGVPVTKLVYLYNPSETQPLQLVSISARTSHFHSSFFDEKVVLSNCNTSFEVVFLARTVGNVENTLFINTAIGTFSYQVFGIGTPNPYRLRPYLGAKVSLNSSFSPLISMHNPTGTPLQITEIYTSSGYLHLQLPTGQHEATKKAWEIPPYETKLLMRASFLGQVADNHTAYIRIRTNHTDATQYLILPVEVEVSSAPGIYSSLDVLDFGTLRTKDEAKVLNLFLLNSGKKEVQVSSIQAQPENPALKVDFRPIKLKPSEAVYTRVANISFDVSPVTSESQWRGKIIIRTKEKSYAKISIPYQANILNGTIGYNESDTFFHIPTKSKTPPPGLARHIALTNTFDFPVILHRLELPDDATSFYKISDFESPVTIGSQDTAACFTLECDADAVRAHGHHGDEHISILHELVLHTNVSTFSLPLQIFTGFLKFKVASGNVQDLDFGIMSTQDRREVLLQVFNHNPLSISLLDINSTVKGVSVRLLSLSTGTGEEIEPTQLNAHFPKFVLPPDSCVSFQVEMEAPGVETSLNGTLNLYTKFEVLKIAIHAKIAIGALTIKPSRIKFPPAFPGMTVHHSISITSSFSQSAKIEALASPDKRFYYRKLKNVVGELEPNKEVRVGKLYFDPRQDCKPDRCYAGLPTSTTVGHHWLTTLSLGKEAPDVDVKLYKTLQERWKSLQKENATSFNATFQLSTSLIRDYEFLALAALYWPTLVDLDEPEYKFPLTHVGKQSVNEISLHNPSDSPIIMQIMPLSIYPQPQAVLKALGLDNLLEREGFTISNQKTFSIAAPPNSSTQDTASQMVWLDYTLNGKANRSCVNFFLNPGQTQNIAITFSPQEDAHSSTVILLRALPACPNAYIAYRNNLTVLEPLLVQGTGVKEELKLGGKLSNKRESLRFKLTESLLRDCLPENRKEAPTFTVRKSFTAKNLGLLPLQVLYTMVDNFPCEGYGFRVLECERYLLQPNATRDIIIAFTPDFTTSQVHRTLRIVTAQGNVLTFNLNVTLPHRMLPACQEAIPRPTWEKPLYYVITISMVALFVGTILAAYLEALNIWEPFVRLYELDRKASSDVTANGSEASSSGKMKPFNLQQINYISNVHGRDQPKGAKRRRSLSSHSNSKAANDHHEEVGRFRAALRDAYQWASGLDLSALVRSWRRTDAEGKTQGETAADDPENRFDVEDTTPPPVSEDLLRRLSVASVSSAASSGKARHRNTGGGGRKSRAHQNNNNGWRASDRRSTKPPRASEAAKVEEKEEVPWSPPENLDYEKKKPATPTRRAPPPPPPTPPPTPPPAVAPSPPASESKKSSSSLRSHSSASSSPSIESSRSRGSSISSEHNGNANTNGHELRKHEVKRRRSNKLVRQHANQENDDTSSTTTDKSNEDLDCSDKVSCSSESPVRRQHRTPEKTIKAKPRERAQPVASETPAYSTADESKGVRRRHNRPNSTSSMKPNKSTPPKVLKKPNFSPAYYDTSSTDEPVYWEDTKVNFTSKEVDERMRALAENTQRADGRLRGKNASKKPLRLAAQASGNDRGQHSHHHNENKENAAHSKSSSGQQRRNKATLMKANSAPDPFPLPTVSQPSPSPMPPHQDNYRRASPVNTFSMFSTPGTSDAAAPRPEAAVTGMPSWNNFGQNSFDITGLMPHVTSPLTPISSPAPSLQWEVASSVFSSPNTSSSSPPNWTGAGGGLMRGAGGPPSPLSAAAPQTSLNGAWPAPRSTHQIWSVSNAVTMDEDRNTGEADPLGLKSIWNSGPYSQRGENNNDNGHNSFYQSL